MALDRTSLGNPFGGLRRLREANVDQTASALQSLTNLGQSVYKEYKEVKSTNDARKAQRDILNKTINPDLEATSGIYKGLVVQAEMADKFNTYKQEIQEGKHSDATPEEFQEMLQKNYAEETKLIADTKYPGIYEGMHSKFWLEKEGTLVAAQRSVHYNKLAKNQELLYTKTLSDSLTTDLNPEQMSAAFDDLFHKAAGNTMTGEKQLQIALAVASNHALKGSDTLLNLLEKKYAVNAIPELRTTFNAAKKAFVQAEESTNQAYIVDEKVKYSRLADEGIFNNSHIQAIMSDPKLKSSVTNEWLVSTQLRSMRENLGKRNLDNAYLRLEAGHDIGYIKPADFNKVFEDKVTSINQQTKDPEQRGALTGKFLRSQTKIPDIIKRESQVFSMSDPIDKEGAVNPNLSESFKYFKALETSDGMTPQQFNNAFTDTDLKNYSILKSYMGTMGGTYDERFKFAAGKLNDINNMSTILSVDTVRLKYEEVDTIIEDKLAEGHSWWKLGESIEDDYKRNMYKSNVMNVAKNEIRRGLSPAAALEYATALTDKNWEHAFGQLQMTGGVSIDAMAGFTKKGQTEEAYEWVLENDPEVKEMLTEIQGKGYKVSELSTVLDNGVLQIGGDLGQAMTISLESIAQKYRNHLSATIDESDPIKESVKNDQFATRLSAMEEKGAEWNRTYNKLKAQDITLDKYIQMSADRKTATRKKVDQEVATIKKPTIVVEDLMPNERTVTITKGLGKKNNNPGNLRFAKQTGATKGAKGFAKFKTPEEGFKALERQIDLDKSRDHTINSFIDKYAPDNENDTEGYIKYITKQLGVPGSTSLKDVDTFELAKYMAKLESGTEVK